LDRAPLAAEVLHRGALKPCYIDTSYSKDSPNEDAEAEKALSLKKFNNAGQNFVFTNKRAKRIKLSGNAKQETKCAHCTKVSSRRNTTISQFLHQSTV